MYACKLFKHIFLGLFPNRFFILNQEHLIRPPEASFKKRSQNICFYVYEIKKEETKVNGKAGRKGEVGKIREKETEHRRRKKDSRRTEEETAERTIERK